MENLPQFLKKLRKDKYNSLDEATENCLVTASSVAFWERGETNPKISLLNDYVKQYGIEFKPCKIETDGTKSS